MSSSKSMARRSAVQALYQWQLTGYDLSEIERQFVEEHGLGKGELPYFQDLLHNVPKALDVVDAALAEFTSRPVEQIDPVERAILRISTYELLQHPDIPYRVVVNEGINLAKEFGATQSHKFVNGLLDKIARKYRAVESAARANR
ncbi:MAG: transcription antitermination factor NusB [Methylococcaceae bacterium]|nr:transcription antitermination factor NusB [Methylococcaceae bacterium]